jgi:hypothetical protein
VANLQTNPLALAALATAAVPNLDVVGARLDHVGVDYVFAQARDKSGRTWVVRLALHAAAEAGQDAELALLTSLAGASSGGALPFEVPRPRGSAALAGGGKAIVYAALPGVPVVMELLDPGPGLAESLGRAIAAFHELPASIVIEAGLPAYTPSEYRARLVAEVDDAAHTGHVSARLERRWREQLERDAWWVFTPVPIHGDMACEHLLEVGGRVSAITDFASVQVSDPAEDLSQLLAPLAPDVAGSIVGAYRRRRADLDDPHLEDRAAFLGEIAIIRWLRHGISLDDQSVIADARSMLADLDQAVGEEEAEAARIATAEAVAAAKLEAAKQAAEAEARERREAAQRASEAAAREHLRTSGSIPRISDEIKLALDDEPLPDSADSIETELGAVGSKPPKRQSVASGGVSLWGRPKKHSDSAWADSVVPDDVWDAVGQAERSEVNPASQPPSREPAEAGYQPVRSSAWGKPSQSEKTAPSPGPDEAAHNQDDSAQPVTAAGPEETDRPEDHAKQPAGTEPTTATTGDSSEPDADVPDAKGPDAAEPDSAEPDSDEPNSDQPDPERPDAVELDSDEVDSGEMTQVFIPDFLKDDSEAPADIVAAAGADETEALDRRQQPDE